MVVEEQKNEYENKKEIDHRGLLPLRESRSCSDYYLWASTEKVQGSVLRGNCPTIIVEDGTLMKFKRIFNIPAIHGESRHWCVTELVQSKTGQTWGRSGWNFEVFSP